MSRSTITADEIRYQRRRRAVQVACFVVTFVPANARYIREAVAERDVVRGSALVARFSVQVLDAVAQIRRMPLEIEGRRARRDALATWWERQQSSEPGPNPVPEEMRDEPLMVLTTVLSVIVGIGTLVHAVHRDRRLGGR